jgi:hypothetical protein
MTQARKNVKSTKKVLQICDSKGGETATTNSQNRKETNLGPSMECSKPMTSSMEPIEWERSHTTRTAKPCPSMESGKTPTSSNEQVETKPAHSSEITQKCETQPTPNKQSERDPQNSKRDDSEKAIATDASTKPHTLRAERTQTKLENFVSESTSKNKHIYVLFDHSSNYIFAEPIQSTSDAAITAAFKKCYQQLKKAGIEPKMHMVDNQCSPLLKQAIESKGMDFQIPGYYESRARTTNGRHWFWGGDASEHVTLIRETQPYDR